MLCRQSPLNLHHFCLTRAPNSYQPKFSGLCTRIDRNAIWHYFASIQLLFIVSICLHLRNKATCKIVSFRNFWYFSIIWQILHRIHNVSRCRLEWWGNFSWHLNIKEIHILYFRYQNLSMSISVPQWRNKVKIHM